MQDLCSWERERRWPLTFCWLSFAPPFNGLSVFLKHATRAIQVRSYQYTHHKRKWGCRTFSFGVFAHGILRYCARKFTLVCGTKKSRHRQTHDTHRKTEIHACTHRLALTDTCTHRVHTHTHTHRRAPRTHSHKQTHTHTHTLTDAHLAHTHTNKHTHTCTHKHQTDTYFPFSSCERLVCSGSVRPPNRPSRKGSVLV